MRVTLGSICTSDLHSKHGFVPRAVPGITVGHEMVGMETFCLFENKLDEVIKISIEP